MSGLDDLFKKWSEHGFNIYARNENDLPKLGASYIPSFINNTNINADIQHDNINQLPSYNANISKNITDNISVGLDFFRNKYVNQQTNNVSYQNGDFNARIDFSPDMPTRYSINYTKKF